MTHVHLIVLAMMLTALAAPLATESVSLRKTAAFASTMNSVGRRHYISSRAMLLAQELRSVGIPRLQGGAAGSCQT